MRVKFLGVALLTATGLTFAAWADDTPSSSELDQMKEAAKGTATEAKEAAKETATEAKEAAKETATEAKEAAKETATDMKEAAKGAAKAAKETAIRHAYDILDKDILSIQFAAGSADLPEADRTKIIAMIQATKEEAKIKKIVVAAWSDKPLPAAGKSLDKADRELAMKRLDMLKSVIKEQGFTNIETHNMAKQANWVEKTFGLSDAQVKKHMQGDQTEDLKYQKLSQSLEEKGGPSRAVVLIRRELIQNASL